MTIDENTYRLLVIGGAWLSGIGSLLAVLVALYLARAEQSVRLKISAGHRLVITPGDVDQAEVIDISVANTGARPAVVTNVLWKMGIFKRQYAVQITGSPLDSLRIHQRLEPGHRGSFYIELDPNDEENWIFRFSKNIPQKFRHIWARRLRVGIATAVGKTIWAPVERSLQQKLVETASEQSTG